MPWQFIYGSHKAAQSGGNHKRNRQLALLNIGSGGMACFMLLAAGRLYSARQRSVPTAIEWHTPGLSYIAVRSNKNGSSSTSYYDRGKYAAFGPDSFYVYSGTDNYVRWIGRTKEQTAQLDTPLAEKRLLELVQREGVDRASKKSGIDRSVLVRFARIYQPSPPRILAYPLPTVPLRSPEFQRQYQKLPDETVAGWPCQVYVSNDTSGDKIWVEPTTHCVLRQHENFGAGNPRLPPSVWDWEVSQFTTVTRISPDRFQIPAGVTVTLPQILSDLPLPPGVHRKILEGKNSYTGGDINRLVTVLESRAHQQNLLR